MAAVTGEQCDKRNGRMWFVVKIGGGLLMLFATLIGVFSTMAYRASAKAEEADKAVTKVQTEVSTAFPYIRQGLSEIKAEQAIQRKMLTEIKRNGGK